MNDSLPLFDEVEGEPDHIKTNDLYRLLTQLSKERKAFAEAQGKLGEPFVRLSQDIRTALARLGYQEKANFEFSVSLFGKTFSVTVK